MIRIIRKIIGTPLIYFGVIIMAIGMLIAVGPKAADAAIEAMRGGLTDFVQKEREKLKSYGFPRR